MTAPVDIRIRFAVRDAVPCNGCTKCCAYDGRPPLEVEPSSQYATFEANGKTYLAAFPNGACFYARPYGCAIYAHRPRICREFDCRVFIDHPHVPEAIRRAGASRE